MSRYLRALKAGGRLPSNAQWSLLVDKATELVESEYVIGVFEISTSAWLHEKIRHVALGPTDMVVSAQMILGIEAIIGRLTEERAEIEALASDDLNAARRDRLTRDIKLAVTSISERLKRGIS